jgi:hypothetical protein
VLLVGCSVLFVGRVGMGWDGLSLLEGETTCCTYVTSVYPESLSSYCTQCLIDALSQRAAA